MTKICNQSKYSIFRDIPSFILHTLYRGCCMKVVCPLAVVAFNLHCFGSDLRPLKWSFCTLYSFCELTMTFSLNNIFIVPSPGGWKSQIQVSQGWFLLRPLSWPCGRPSSPRVLMWSPLCVCLCPNLPLLSGHSPIGSRTPYDLVLP